MSAEVTIALAYTSIANSGDRWVLFSIPGKPFVHRYFRHGEDQARHPLSDETQVQYVGDRDFDELVASLSLPPIADWPLVDEELR